MCYNCEEDGCKYEWENCYENDGTPDNSEWTSLETDGIMETSPSINNVYENQSADASDTDDEEEE